MSKVEKLKEQVAELESSLPMMDADEKKMVQDGIDELNSQIAELESGKKTDSKLEKTAKKSVKKVKMQKMGKSKTYARPEKKATNTKEEKPDCNELAALWEKRKKAAKESAGKKTAPIMKRAAESMEKIVRSGIQYNKDNGGSLKVEKLKKAVTAMEDALDAFKSALNGKFEDLYIKKFKSDMKEVIKAAEKAANE